MGATGGGFGSPVRYENQRGIKKVKQRRQKNLSKKRFKPTRTNAGFRFAMPAPK